MTEQHPSFGGVAVADPRTTTSPLDLGAEGAPDDNRRKLALVGAVVAVLVVLIAAFFMLKSKGGSADNTALPPHIVPPATSGQSGTTSGTTAAAAPKPIKLPKPFAGVVGRDPFKALYVPPAPKDTSAPTGAASNPVAAAPPTTVTSTGGSTSTPPSTGTTGGSPTVGSNFDPVWVELVHVTGTKSATFVVGYSNGKKTTQVTYTADAPQDSSRTVFGRVFSLLSIQNGTATVQMGDGTPFDLSKGFSNRHFLG
jgi:hypothetical protein